MRGSLAVGSDHVMKGEGMATDAMMWWSTAAGTALCFVLNRCCCSCEVASLLGTAYWLIAQLSVFDEICLRAPCKPRCKLVKRDIHFVQSGREKRSMGERFWRCDRERACVGKSRLLLLLKVENTLAGRWGLGMHTCHTCRHA